MCSLHRAMCGNASAFRGNTRAVDEHLTGFKNLDMIGRLYQLGRKSSRVRSRELLEQFDLVEASDRAGEDLLEWNATAPGSCRSVGCLTARAFSR